MLQVCSTRNSERVVSHNFCEVYFQEIKQVLPICFASRQIWNYFIDVKQALKSYKWRRVRCLIWLLGISRCGEAGYINCPRWLQRVSEGHRSFCDRREGHRSFCDRREGFENTSHSVKKNRFSLNTRKKLNLWLNTDKPSRVLKRVGGHTNFIFMAKQSVVGVSSNFFRLKKVSRAGAVKPKNCVGGHSKGLTDEGQMP